MKRMIAPIIGALAVLAVVAVHFGYLPQEPLLLIGGVGFTVMGIWMFLVSKNMIKTGGYTSAVVIETRRERVRGGNAGYTYAPILEYKVDKTIHQARAHGYAKPKYEDGATVEIKYNKKDVEQVEVVGDSKVWIGALVFLAGGLVMLGVGLYMQFS